MVTMLRFKNFAHLSLLGIKSNFLESANHLPSRKPPQIPSFFLTAAFWVFQRNLRKFINRGLIPKGSSQFIISFLDFREFLTENMSGLHMCACFQFGSLFFFFFRFRRFSCLLFFFIFLFFFFSLLLFILWHSSKIK